MVGPDRYVVESRVFIPMAMSEDSLRRFGETAERFILTLEHNLLVGSEGSEKRMERAVFADHGIPESRLESCWTA